MDEVFDAVEIASDLGLEGAFAWVLRIVGLLLVVGGLGLWLLGDVSLFFVPAVLLVAGIVLLVAPSVLLALTELA